MKDFADWLIRLFPAYFEDFLDLVAGPKRFLTKQASDAKRLERALSFVALSFAITYVLKLPFQRGELWLEIAASIAFAFMEWFLIGAAIWLAWRVAGGLGSLRDTLFVWFYLAGVVHYLQTIAFLLYLGTLRVLSPSMYEYVMTALYSGQYLQLALEADGPLHEPAARIASALAIAALIVAALWIVVGWGAFRSVHARGRWNSGLALVLAALFCLPVWAILALLASALVR